MNSEAKFYDMLRAGNMLGPQLSPSEVSGLSAILTAMQGAPLAWTAYALATAYLETGHTMQPVKEANWLSDDAAHRYFMRMYDITGNRPEKARELGNLEPGDGAKYCGRGFPQVTGGKNYRLAAQVFGIPFDIKPDLMLDAEPAAKVMAHFMKRGLFTGKSFGDYLPSAGPASLAQFIGARRIINGTDRAADIAAYAMQFQRALQAGGWS